MTPRIGRKFAVAVAILLVAGVAVALVHMHRRARGVAAGGGDHIAAWKGQFARPAFVPFPADNVPTPARVALGQRLFTDTRLSIDTTVSCATCHDPALAFTDGAALGRGVARQPLDRHTPTLWNSAWAHAFFWDGRAGTLEEQARFPIEHPKEMGQSLEAGAARLGQDTDYARAFASAFPEDPRISAANILKALASFERTLISPPTRFDRWIAGDAEALGPSEIRGFELFTGKARCVSCHSGWAFTDNGFHDIGLPGDDLGRGPVIGLPAVDRAFKTPGLRELAWTAPYMHDGSLATLDDVVRHYERGGVDRKTRSPDMPRVQQLSDAARDDLIAFLESLSSERPPRPATDMQFTGIAAPTAPAVATSRMSQKDKTFLPARVTLRTGDTLTILNDDTRPHNVRVFDPRMKFNSGLQEPGERVTVPFAQSGMFDVFCGIHPSMRATIEVK